MPKNMTFKDKIRTRSGKCFDGELIYVTTRDGKGRPRFVHGRRIVENLRITDHQTNFGERAMQSVDLYRRLPSSFKNDLDRYARGYNMKYRGDMKPVSGFNLFIGVLGRRPSQIYSLMSLSQTLGNSINDWMEAGILKRLPNHYIFTATIL